MPNTELNHQDILALFAETDARMKETDARMKETDARMKETDARMKETDQQMKDTDERIKETDQQMKETDRKLQETSRLVDKVTRSMEKFSGFIGNDARLVEDFFIEALENRNLTVAGIAFDEILPNARRRRLRGENSEFDAILLNGDYVGLLETKKLLHRNDVIAMREKRIPRFCEFYPEHARKKLVPMIAGEGINPDALAAAHDEGFVILSPVGQDIAVDDSAFHK